MNKLKQRLWIGIAFGTFILLSPACFSLSAQEHMENPGDTGNKENREIDEILGHASRIVGLRDNNLYDGHFLLEHKNVLGLTDKQEEKIENMMLELETYCIQKTAEIKVKELQFASYLNSLDKKAARNEIDRHIREISSEKTDLIVYYMNYLLDLRELLTPKQVDILKKKCRFPEKCEPPRQED